MLTPSFVLYRVQLQEFLNRENQLSILVNSNPSTSRPIAPSLSEDVENRQQAIVSSYQKLLKAIDAKPLLILYASDGGRAQDCARRLAAEGMCTLLLVLIIGVY